MGDQGSLCCFIFDCVTFPSLPLPLSLSLELLLYSLFMQWLLVLVLIKVVRMW
jgi:hypothetical protein